MDWSGCQLVEVSGHPVIAGTTVSADALLSQMLTGSSVEEVASAFPALAVGAVRDVLTYAVERLGWDAKTLVDWSGCSLVERVPGRCSGAPTVVGTRIFPDTIAEYFWSGAAVDEILEDYPSLSREMVVGLIEYVKAQKSSAA
jgi:uncharacterized protein (DUF433 family)